VNPLRAFKGLIVNGSYLGSSFNAVALVEETILRRFDRDLSQQRVGRRRTATGLGETRALRNAWHPEIDRTRASSYWGLGRLPTKQRSPDKLCFRLDGS